VQSYRRGHIILTHVIKGKPVSDFFSVYLLSRYRHVVWWRWTYVWLAVRSRQPLQTNVRCTKIHRTTHVILKSVLYIDSLKYVESAGITRGYGTGTTESIWIH